MLHSMYLLFLIFVSNSLFFNVTQAISISIPRPDSSSGSDDNESSRSSRDEDDRRREYLENRAEERRREEERREEARREPEAWRAESRRVEESRVENECEQARIRQQEEEDYEERRRRRYEEDREEAERKKREDEESDKRYWQEREEEQRQEQIRLKKVLEEAQKKEKTTNIQSTEAKTETNAKQQENIEQVQAAIRVEKAQSIENSQKRLPVETEENDITDYSVQDDIRLSVYQQTLEKFKDVNFVKRLFKQRLMSEISGYDVTIDHSLFSLADIDELDVHLSRPIDSSECVYIAAQNGIPYCIYMVSEDGNSSSVHILSEREKKDLINAFVFTPGIAGPLIGGGGIATGGFIPIIVGGGLTVGWIFKVGIPFLLKWKEKRNGGGGGGGSSDSDNRRGGGGNNNNNDDDDKIKRDKRSVKSAEKSAQKSFKKKHPERTYEPNLKHHQNARDGVGKPPKYPEESLDEALNAKGKDSLVVIEDDHFVMFHEHAPNKYHGYIVKNFDDLRPFAQKALKKARLVHPKTGKIL